MKEMYVRGADRPAIVDDEDYPLLSRFVWRFSPTTGYVVASIGNQGIQLNRFIFGSQAKPYFLIVYRDGDKFNNQKSNLEFWRHSDHAKFTRRGRTATSRYWGVFFHRPMCKWCVKARVNGKQLPIAYFDNEEDAAKHYIKLMAKHAKKRYTLDDLLEKKLRFRPAYEPVLSVRNVIMAGVACRKPLSTFNSCQVKPFFPVARII